MTYKEWFESHAEKHRAIVEKLGDLSDEELIRYFRFDNMVKREPDFCPLYSTKTKCHEMEDLNCYLCACPHFRFDDEGIYTVGEKTLFSTCAIDAKEGKQFISDDAIHQDCSGCMIPHKEAYIRKHFSRDWREIMKESDHSSSNSG